MGSSSGKSPWKLACLGVLLVGIGIAIWIGVTISNNVRFKTSAHHPDRDPRAGQDSVNPELQFEDHTCGLHALSSLYRSFGLDPEEENLRVRLGVDTPAVPGDGSSTGTIHPDLFRVMLDDQLGYDLLPPRESDTPEKLRTALAAGHPAMILVARPPRGNLHWVAADQVSDGGGIRISDSLEETPTFRDLSEFLHTEVLSIVVVRPLGTEEKRKPHWEGMSEMNAVGQRIREIDAP